MHPPNAPRPSILLQFDPLNTADGASEADDLFPHPRNPSPVRLTRRLVDVGDVTALLDCEDDNDEPQDPVEHTPKGHKQSCLLGEGTPRANATLSPPSLVVLGADDDNDTYMPISVATPSPYIQTPSGSLITETILALPTPSPAPSLLVPKVSDPHASFVLHEDIEGGNNSFDLLNDKISFLGHVDDESFEMPRSEEDTKTQELAEPAPQSAPVAHPSVSSTIPREVTSGPHILATPPAASTILAAPPPLVPALKIVKRTPSIVPATIRPRVFTAPPKVPSPAPVEASPKPATSPVGQFVVDGPGPRRVPNLNSHTANNTKSDAAAKQLSGPRRVLVQNAPAAKATSPSVAETNVKRPLRAVATNTEYGACFGVVATWEPLADAQVQDRCAYEYSCMYIRRIVNWRPPFWIMTSHAQSSPQLAPNHHLSSLTPNEEPRMSTKFVDYYGILNVSKTATTEEIRTAYKKESLRTHPDRLVNATPSERKKATERFQVVADGYYILSDPTRRREYDVLYASRARDRTAEPDAGSSNAFFSQFASMFGNSSGAGAEAKNAPPEPERPDADGVFADVFEELLRPEVQRHAPWWAWFGAACGAGVGFIIANVPGLMVGAVAGNRLGAIRDAKGKSVAAVFTDLHGNQKAEILRALAVKVLGAAASI
ncbi:J domain-containing protein [Mycena chlorophos]|uniref:J domain-containing protein n=1 Tax=Mycena chlorophos TaxID=658473 RepID=A0A8H6WG49_MYCCL|nr:J domain-containing protein [Mycena chlorophos]